MVAIRAQNQQKAKRFITSEWNLDRFKRYKVKQIKKFASKMDKTLCHFSPESSRQLSESNAQNEPDPKPDKVQVFI